MADKVHFTAHQKDLGLKQIAREVQLLKTAYLTVGVHEDAGTYEAEGGEEPVPVSKVAFWLEEGTQYMPARPFFYPAIANNIDGIKKRFAKAAVMVTAGRLGVELALGQIGFAVQTWVQNAIKSNVPPPLSPDYLKARRALYPEQGARTLIRSGLLLRSVRYKLFLGGEPIDGPETGPDAVEAPAHPDSHASKGERRAAVGEALAEKAQRREQRQAAKANPEAFKARFNAQRRAFVSHTPKGSG